MTIDAGLSLSYNAAYPVSGVNQSSQQFRDNFAIVKAAVENLQSSASTNASVLSLSASVSSNNGAVSWTVAYRNNALILPIGAPTIPAVAGMIHFNAPDLEFYDGSSWNAVAKSSTAIVAGTGLSGGGPLTGNVTLTLAASLGQLSNVSLSPLADGDTIVYNATTGKFSNVPVGTIAAANVTFAGGTTVQDAVTTIGAQATSASASAASAETSALGAVTTANAVESSLADAVSQASAAHTASTGAVTTAADALTVANTANATASGLSASISASVTAATGAVATANNALTAANAANATATGLQTTVDALQTTVGIVQIQSNNTVSVAGDAATAADSALAIAASLQTSVTALTTDYTGVQSTLSTLGTSVNDLSATTQAAIGIIANFDNYVPPSQTVSVTVRVPNDFTDISSALSAFESKISTPNASVVVSLLDGTYALPSSLTIANDIKNVSISCNTYTAIASAISGITLAGTNAYTVVFNVDATTHFTVGNYVSVSLIGTGNYDPIVGLWPIAAVTTNTVSLGVTSMTDITGAAITSGNLVCYGATITTIGDGFFVNGAFGGISVPLVGAGATGSGVTVGNGGKLVGKCLIAGFATGIANNGAVNADCIVSNCTTGVANSSARMVGNIIVSGGGIGISNTMSDLRLITGTVAGNTSGISNARSSRASIHNNNTIVGNASTSQLVSTLGSHADLQGSTIVVSPSLNTLSSDGSINYA